MEKQKVFGAATVTPRWIIALIIFLFVIAPGIILLIILLQKKPPGPTPTPLGQACKLNSDCNITGQICQKNKCVNCNNQKGPYCAPGSQCVDGLCKPFVAPDSSCAEDKDCAKGLKCISSKCKQCAKNEDCKLAGQACTEDGKCIEAWEYVGCYMEQGDWPDLQDLSKAYPNIQAVFSAADNKGVKYVAMIRHTNSNSPSTLWSVYGFHHLPSAARKETGCENNMDDGGKIVGCSKEDAWAASNECKRTSWAIYRHI